MWNIADESCAYFNEPDIEENPIAWYDWYDSCLIIPETEDPEPPTPPDPPPCRPRKFTANGNCWEIVCTEEGPEIRPCLKPNTNRVSTTIRVLVQSALGFKAITIKHGKIKLKHLASAMIYKKALPDANIKKVGTKFWSGLKELEGIKKNKK